MYNAQVIFHVATLMPSTREKSKSVTNPTNASYFIIQKKKHIGNHVVLCFFLCSLCLLIVYCIILGNDYVVIVWNDNTTSTFDIKVIKGNLTAVYLVCTPVASGLIRYIYPLSYELLKVYPRSLNSLCFYRVETLVKKGLSLPSFGPLSEGTHLVSFSSLPFLIRRTAFNANLVCSMINDKKVSFSR
jgi:hypothetical protein